MNERAIFKQLLDPKFDWKKVNSYETLVSLAQDAVALKDLPQRILGKIINQIDTSKYHARANFAKEVGASPHNLKIYGWVEKKLEGLDIPEDIPWSSLRTIAHTKDPKKWVDRIHDEGLSFADVKRLILKEKGIQPKEKHDHKKVTCPHCGFETEGIKCGGCGEVL